MLTINDRKEEYKYLKMPIIVEKGKKLNLMIKMNKKGGGKWEEVR